MRGEGVPGGSHCLKGGLGNLDEPRATHSASVIVTETCSVGAVVLSSAGRRPERGDRRRARADGADEPLGEPWVLEVVHGAQLDGVARDDRLVPHVLAGEAQARLGARREHERLAGGVGGDRLGRLARAVAGNRVFPAAAGDEREDDKRHEAGHGPHSLTEVVVE